MTSHRIKDRRKSVHGGVLACVFGVAVTSQNNSLGWVAANGMSSANTEVAFSFGYSGQSPLGVNHLEPATKDKVGPVLRSRLVESQTQSSIDRRNFRR
jgi:hypothetical protein